MQQTCDQCGVGVRACIIVSLPSGGVLLYCRHHANEHREALTGRGARLYDMDETEVDI